MKELKTLDHLDRRRFAERLAASALGLSVFPAAEPLLAAGRGTAKQVIYLHMAGGMSHLDTFDPKPSAGAEILGATGTVETGMPGVQFSSYLPQLAKRFGDVAVVRTLTQKTGAHEGATYWMQTGRQDTPAHPYPNLGAIAEAVLGKNNPDLPGTVYVGQGGGPGSGFLGPAYTPLPVYDPSRGLPNANPPVEGDRLEHRITALETMNQAFRKKYRTREVQAYTKYYQATLNFMQGKDLEIFDITKEPASVRNRYGTGKFGQGLLLARRLVQGGVRFVRVSHGGWDMHNDLWQRIDSVASAMDQGVSALIDDLKSLDLLDQTLVVLTTEFGRTPTINSNSGRDHSPRCFSAMLAGGGIRGGQVYGTSDLNGYAPEQDPCSVEDFNATIAQALRIDPGHRLHMPNGRPFLVSNGGTPIAPFFS